MNYEDARARLVERAALLNRRHVAAVLELGRLATIAIRARLKTLPREGRRLERSRTVADLRTAADAPELARWIRCWGTAEAFGIDQAKDLPLNTLRAFAPLVKRNGQHETWTVRAKHREWASALWASAAATPTAQIMATVRQRLHPNAPPTVKTKPAPIARSAASIAEELATLSDTEQRIIALQILERLDKKIPISPTPSTGPTKSLSSWLSARKAG